MIVFLFHNKRSNGVAITMRYFGIFLLVAICFFTTSNCYSLENGTEDKIKLSAGYDCWYTMWDVYVPDPEFTDYHDYDIDPTLIHGFFVTASSAKTGTGSWDLMIGAYGDYISKKQEDEAGEEAKILQALMSYGITGETRLVTQFQSGNFEGELIGQYKFETDWIKTDLLLMSPGSEGKNSSWFGWGLRYTQYSMPLEFTHYEEIGGEYVDVGHEVIEIETKGIAILLKNLEPMIFGYDDNKWYFIDYDVAFGISFADAEEFKDDVVGFQFNFEVDAGIKHSFKIGNGFLGLKAGYRVFFDGQILSEWENEHGESTSSTIRNFFHGPFIMIMGTF